jgi:hypothetical protein
MMSGPWTAKEYVSWYLQEDLPKRIVGYRNLWQLDSERLPVPEKYFSYEPPALDHWPMLITVALSTPSMTRTDYTDGMNPIYRVAYNMRTYIWVRQSHAELATESRDRLTTVIRSALLDRQSLSSLDSEDHELLIDETSMREEFSDITYVKGDRAVAGSFIAYTLWLNEAITRPNVFTPTATEIDPDTGVANGTTTDVSGIYGVLSPDEG